MSNADFDKLRSFVIDDLVTDDIDVDDDTSLFSTRVVNSRNLMSLVRFIETEYSIKINPMDMTLENFDTLGRMVTYISGKI